MLSAFPEKYSLSAPFKVTRLSLTPPLFVLARQDLLFGPFFCLFRNVLKLKYQEDLGSLVEHNLQCAPRSC